MAAVHSYSCTEPTSYIECTEEAIGAISTLDADTILSTDEKGDTLLHLAINEGVYVEVEAILKRVVERDLYPSNHSEVVAATKLLLVQNQKGETPLHIAVNMCQDDDPESMKTLELVVDFIRDLCERTRKDRISKLLTLKTVVGDIVLHIAPSSYFASTLCINLAEEVGICFIKKLLTLKNRRWETPLQAIKEYETLKVYKKYI
jgi:hypothetical protein